MYAIVEIAGQQFKVSKDLKVYVNRLSNEEGSKVSFDKVLLLDDNGTITLGAPAVEGASVEAKVLQHLKGEKAAAPKKAAVEVATEEEVEAPKVKKAPKAKKEDTQE